VALAAKSTATAEAGCADILEGTQMSDMSNEDLSLLQKALDMRQALDLLEGALMRFGDLVDYPTKWGEPVLRRAVTVTIRVNAGQIYDVCAALAEATRIVNDEDYAPKALGAK
jgi:hypothetical protein